MNKLNKKYCILDIVGLLIMGLLCFEYIIFPKFAEEHLQLSFLNFPIFVGEIAFFACLILFLAKYARNFKKLQKWHYLIICYFVFILIKALCGYLEWGPFALRHSALFYYPAFIIFGYVFFRRNFFDWKVGTFLILVIFTLFATGKSHGYFTYTLAALAFILIKSHPHRIFKLVMFLAILAVIPYGDFFVTSRMMIVSHLLVGVYLIGVVPFIWEGKRKFKILFAVMMGGIILLGMFKTANHNALKSIVDFKLMRENFILHDKVIKANVGDYDIESQREVMLYNPDRVVHVASQERREEEESFQEPLETEIRRDRINQVERNVEKIFVEQENQELSGGTTKVEIRQDFVEKVKGEIEAEVAKNIQIVSKPVEQGPYINNHNAIFRIFIWRDMLADFVNKKPKLFFGFDFGKPFRSVSLEVLNWGTGDWHRDGWISAHNSYVHMFYRAGLVGVLLIACFLTTLFCMIRKFIKRKSLTGILLCGILINWFAAANFLPILELPYWAIPIWTVYGVTFAYCYKIQEKT